MNDDRSPNAVPDPNAQVLASIVIPCRNERSSIEAVLDDLAAQDIDKLLEIVVADGMSDDGTREILARYGGFAGVGHSLIVVDNASISTPSGLNAAVRSARGRYIVRVDAHSRLSPDYVRCIVEALGSGVGDVVGPQISYRPAVASSVARTISAMLNTVFGNGGTPSRNRLQAPVRAMHAVMSCYDRQVWTDLGGYDESILSNEDFEFDYRANRAGFRVVSLPHPRFRAIARPTLATFAKQRWRYGIWKARVLLKHPGSMRLRQLVPMLILPGALVAWIAFPATATVLTLLYCAAAAGFTLAEHSMRELPLAEKLRCAVVAPLVAAVNHFTWAAGVWYGFLVRRTG